MICSKCEKDFLEKDIELSHDIPQWLGGKDVDGRHNLCRKCHREYEDEVIRMVTMNVLGDLNEKANFKYKWCADVVKKYYFKEDDNGNSI